MTAAEKIIEIGKVGLGPAYLAFVFGQLEPVLILKSLAIMWPWPRALLSAFAFWVALRFFEEYRKQLWQRCLIVFYAACVLSVLGYGNLGTHVEDADPLFGGGDIVVDYEPTNTQRHQAGARVFFGVLIPGLLGTVVGWKTKG